MYVAIYATANTEKSKLSVRVFRSTSEVKVENF